MKFIRITLAVLILLILVSGVALVSVAMLIDPNQLKPALIQQVKNSTGYDLTIEGQLKWSFYPHISIDIPHMSMREPGEAQNFLDLTDVKMAVHLPALLRGHHKLNGHLTIATARFANINAQQISVDMRWQDQVLTLQPIKANLYEGSLQGIAHGRFEGNVPQWDGDITLDQIQLQPLLADIHNDSKLTLSGVGRVKVTLNTQGKDKQTILNSLNVLGEINLANGIVSGININYLMDSANALLNRKPLPPPTDLNQTVFQNLSGSFFIKKGIASTDNLVLVAPTFTTTATGTFALTTNTIDLGLQIKPQQNNIPPQTAWYVPVIVQGNLNHPDIRLSMSDIRSMLLKQEIDKVKAKAREVIKTHIPGKAGMFLQNLLSG